MYSWNILQKRKKENDIMCATMKTKNLHFDIDFIKDIFLKNNFIFIFVKKDNTILYDILYYEKNIDMFDREIDIYSMYLPIYDKSIRSFVDDFKKYTQDTIWDVLIYHGGLGFYKDKPWWVDYYIQTKHTDRCAFITFQHNISDGIYKYNETKVSHLKMYNTFPNFKFLKSDQVMFIDNKHIVTRKQIYNYHKGFKPWFNRMMKFVKN